jgi:prepilin-type N-terminal cleavage/methylation domain-containing protein
MKSLSLVYSRGVETTIFMYKRSIMKLPSARGFTLIELLVVIAIIGILASVVLASLNSARDKGVDAKVKANLTGFKANAAIYYDDNSSAYTGFCTSQATLDSLGSATSTVASIVTLGGLGDGECLDTGGSWAAWVNLREASTTAWCVDSTGMSGSIAAQDSSAVDHYSCP